MSNIARQTFKSTVYIYIGVVIGFINTAILFPVYLTPDEIGTLGLLVAYSTLFANGALLGFGNAAIRYFPFFRNPQRNHNGFLTLLTLVMLLGFILVSGIILFFQDWFVRMQDKDSAIFAELIYLVLPLTLAQLLFLGYDTFNRVLFNASTGALLREFILRLFILAFLVLFIFNLVNFTWYSHLFTLAYFLVTGLLILFLIRKKNFSFNRPKLDILSREQTNEMISLSLLGFFNGMASFIVVRIDTLMINEFYGTAETGIYLTLMNFGTLVIMPTRALRGIAPTYIGEAIQKENWQEIQAIYRNTSLEQLALGSLLLLGLWTNNHNVLAFLPDEYHTGYYVILFIGSMNLVKMAFGLADAIIGASSRFKTNTWLMLLLVSLTLGLNFMFIPQYNINGAAFASMLAVLLVALTRYILVLRYFSVSPFTYRHLLVLGIAALVWLLQGLIPEFSSFYFDTFIRGLFVLITYLVLIFAGNIFPAWNNRANRYLGRKS
jgi:O-antigen/teichoic acid export membrane protein